MCGTVLQLGIRKYEVGPQMQVWDKGSQIHVLDSVVSGKRNSNFPLCGNRWRAGIGSKTKGLINILPNGVDAGTPRGNG